MFNVSLEVEMLHFVRKFDQHLQPRNLVRWITTMIVWKKMFPFKYGQIWCLCWIFFGCSRKEASMTLPEGEYEYRH